MAESGIRKSRLCDRGGRRSMASPLNRGGFAGCSSAIRCLFVSWCSPAVAMPTTCDVISVIDSPLIAEGGLAHGTAAQRQCSASPHESHGGHLLDFSRYRHLGAVDQYFGEVPLTLPQTQP